MPLRSMLNLPAPMDAQEFELQVKDVLQIHHAGAHLVRFGRNGQAQHGIDGFDSSAPADQRIVWQATLKKKRLRQKLQHDLAKMDNAGLHAAMFIFALGIDADARLQELAVSISEMRARSARSAVRIVFWPEIRETILAHDALFARWFPELIASKAFVGIGRSRSCLFCFAELDDRAAECKCGAIVRDKPTDAEVGGVVLRQAFPALAMALLLLVGLPMLANEYLGTQLSLGLGLGSWSLGPSVVAIAIYGLWRAREPLQREAARGLRYYRRCWTGEVWPSGCPKIGVQLRVGTPDRYEAAWLSFEPDPLAKT